MKKHTECNLPLGFAFIDYKKAFDSVYTSAVVKSFKDIGIDKPLIYKNATPTIRLDRGKAKIKLEIAVRQKNTIFPKLFTVVLENIYRKLNWENKGIKINGELLSYLKFVDDILILSKSPEDMDLKDLE